MSNETQDKIDVLVEGLLKKAEDYSIASTNNAGFDERRIILKEIRSIQEEIQILKDRLESLEE